MLRLLAHAQLPEAGRCHGGRQLGSRELGDRVGVLFGSEPVGNADRVVERDPVEIVDEGLDVLSEGVQGGVGEVATALGSGQLA